MVCRPGSLQAPVGSGNNHIPPTDKLGALGAERGRAQRRGNVGSVLGQGRVGAGLPEPGTHADGQLMAPSPPRRREDQYWRDRMGNPGHLEEGTGKTGLGGRRAFFIPPPPKPGASWEGPPLHWHQRLASAHHVTTQTAHPLTPIWARSGRGRRLEDCRGEAVRGGGARAALQEQVSASCLSLLWSHVSPHSQV